MPFCHGVLVSRCHNVMSSPDHGLTLAVRMGLDQKITWPYWLHHVMCVIAHVRDMV